MRWSKLAGKAGTTNAAPIDAPDIMPTLLGFAGLPIPRSVEGVDWSPFIRGEKALCGDEAAFLNMAAEFTEIQRNGMSAYRGLRTTTHTYVRTAKGPWLLFDNVADPYQMKNLIGKPQHAALQAELEQRLKERLAQRGDEFLDSRTYVERAGLTHYKEVNLPVVKAWKSPWEE